MHDYYENYDEMPTPEDYSNECWFKTALDSYNESKAE